MTGKLTYQTVDTFNEIFKVVFAKLYDERVNLFSATSVAKFRIGLTDDQSTAANTVRSLFEAAKVKPRTGGGAAHHNTKGPAIEKAKRIAKAADLGQAVIRKENNRIQTEYTYGQDPKRRKG